MDRGVVRKAASSLRKAITGVESSCRYHDHSRRLRVVHYFNEDRDTPSESYQDVRAWWLKEDELVAEKNAQRLGERGRRSWDRELIVEAEIIPGRTIIKEGEHAER